MARGKVLPEKEKAMNARAYVRVTMAADGRTAVYELMANGLKVLEWDSPTEYVDFLTQATSAFRFAVPHVRMPHA